MVPTRRLVLLAFVASGVALVAGFVPGIDFAWILLDLVVLGMAGGDTLFGRRQRVDAERHAPRIFSVGRSNRVTLTLHNASAGIVRGTVTDDPIEDATIAGLPARFELPPHASATLDYTITPTRRGTRKLQAITVRYALPFGMLQRQERIERPQELDVYPDVHAARELAMLRRQGRADARLGSLRVRGGDTEFERLRPYQRGDEVRHVDWRASAKRDEPVVRQFQAESNQNVVFAIDVGRGMRGESGGITSIDHALAAALLTADVALRGGDKAGLLTFDDRPRTFLRPSGGSLGGRKLTRAVHAIDAGVAATDFRSAMVFLKTQVKTRSLFVVFTNVLEPRGADELAFAVRGLMPRHLPLCVLMQDPSAEALALAPVERAGDAFVRAAAGESLGFRADVIAKLRAAGALVLDAPPSAVTPELVKRYLEVKARRLL